MRYQPTIRMNRPETLKGYQPGQWIDYEGSRGRYMGARNGVQWIAWGKTATVRFTVFARVYRETH